MKISLTGSFKMGLHLLEGKGSRGYIKSFLKDNILGRCYVWLR